MSFLLTQEQVRKRPPFLGTEKNYVLTQCKPLSRTPFQNNLSMLYDNMVRADYLIRQTQGVGGASGEFLAVPVDHPDVGSVEPYLGSSISSLLNQTIIAESECASMKRVFGACEKM